MIPVNFSLTRLNIAFIQKQVNAKPKNRVLKIAQNQVLPRIAALALSSFALFDLLAHAFGAASAGCVALVKGASDFSDAKKHLKCVRVFAKIFPLLSCIGIFSPQEIKILESSSLATTSALLLSRDQAYSKDIIVDSLTMITRLEKLSKQLPPEKKKGMEESLDLLKGGKRILKELAVLHRHKMLNKLNLTSALASLVKKLRANDRNLFEKIFLKECLSRVLALGLSITAALDLMIEIFFTPFLMLSLHLIKLLMGKHSEAACSLHQDYLLHLRNMASALIGIASGSVVGVINPDLGCKMSSITKKFNFSIERIQKKIFKEIKNLKNNESILIPISFPTGSHGGHIVYCLVTREEAKYRVNILNKGWGARYAGNFYNGKSPINYPVNGTSFKEVKDYLGNLLLLSTESYKKVTKKAKNQTIRQIMMRKLYPGRLPNERLLLGKPQAIGDCPRASLMAALYFHSALANKPFDPVPYKRFKRHLKDHVFKEEGHLLDISLSLKGQKILPSDYVREKHKKGWEKFHRRFPSPQVVN